MFHKHHHNLWILLLKHNPPFKRCDKIFCLLEFNNNMNTFISYFSHSTFARSKTSEICLYCLQAKIMIALPYTVMLTRARTLKNTEAILNMEINSTQPVS